VTTSSIELLHDISTSNVGGGAAGDGEAGRDRVSASEGSYER